MTTLTSFVPSPYQAFQFQATLDGSTYNVTVTWNLYRQGYYINIVSLTGVVIVTRAMVGSPTGYDISLTKGYFTSTLVWRPSTGNFEVSP